MANSCKYYKQKKQFSTNSGQTWQDVTPFEYRSGSFIEADSPDCREGTLISRWVTVPNAFLCNGKDEYEKQVGQYSLDNGITWQYYYPSIYQTGNLIEANAELCNNKWEGYYEYTGSTGNLCPLGYVYVQGRGCVLPVVQKYDPIKYIRCSTSTSTTITSADTRYGTEEAYSSYYGIIGDCVTEIGDAAFSGYTSLSSITIPNGVTSIGQDAFRNCSSLTSVGCEGSNSSIEIPNGVSVINNRTFWGCSGLTSVTIPSGVTSIGNSAFRECRSLTNITIFDGITSIGEYAFYNCSGLTSIIIPNSVTSIGRWAFMYCRSLSSVTISTGITTINNATFDTCTSLTSVTIPNSVTSIGVDAFEHCSGLTSIVIPDSVTSIDNSAFQYCYGLKSVTIGSNVTSIGQQAFRNCSGLTSVTIPDSVTSIGRSAFTNCYELTSVTIGSGVTSIGEWAFGYCSGLTSITINATTPPTFDGYYEFFETNDCPIYVPCESVNTYKTARDWSGYASRIVGNCPKWTATYSDSHTESAQCGSSSAITNNEITKSGLTSVEIGDCVTSIGQNVFSGCTTLTSITIPNSVTSIGYNAFYNCSGLTSVTIPSGVTTIEGWTFYNCDGLTSITIPSGVTSIGTSAFMSCSNIEDITIPNTVTSIGTYAFSNCISLQTVTLPNSITTLPDSTFRECDNLAMINSDNIGEFNIPSGVITLGYGLFTSCYALQYLIIPSTVTTIEKNILQGCRDVLVVCNAVNPPALTDTLGGSIAQIRVPSASVEAYKSASGWSQYANKIYPN